MFLQNNLRRFVLILSVLLFAGCASNGAKQTSNKDGGVPTTSSTGAATNEASSPQPVVANKPTVVIPNPSIILFEKMSIVLDDQGKATIALLSERARSASKLVVTGFCDHRQVGNSADSAVARAVAVRDELVANGVTPTNIRVKFSTKIAKKHAAEIRFD